MPIYEYYCTDCHTIYNFFSRRINTEKIPACPHPDCGNPKLKRQMSTFSVSKGLTEGGTEDVLDGLDENKVEQAMMSLGRDIEGLDEEDPRQAAQVMRKLFSATDLKLGPGMEEAICRMEAGEDPDKVEAEMGDILEQEDAIVGKPVNMLKDLGRKLLPPKVDDTLHDLV